MLLVDGQPVSAESVFNHFDRVFLGGLKILRNSATTHYYKSRRNS